MIDADLSLRASHLQRFCSILSFELSTIVIFFLQFLWQLTLFLAVLTLFLAVLAAILFIPYLIFILIKEKKYDWITLFILIVILPLIVIILFLSDHLFYLAYLQIPLPLFYFYCFLLRFDAKEWLKEVNWKIYNEERKSEPNLSNEFITPR
jgi:hypothetical protein